MNRGRDLCGKVTASGAPCQNGSGCTVNHHAVAGGPAAMTVTVAGAGPDPFAAGPTSSGAGAASLDDVLAGGGTPAQQSAAQRDALPGELDALGLDPGVLSEELTATVVESAAAYEGNIDPDLDDRGAWLELAARQTLLYEYHSAAAAAVNQRRKITTSVLRDDHGLVSGVVGRLFTIFTPPAKLAEVRAKKAAKAAAKGKDFDPDSDNVVTNGDVQQMAIAGAKIRGAKKEKKWSSGRPKQPEGRRLATVYQQLAAMKATDPDRYDRFIAGLAEETSP